jgi:hypothetical protein
MRKSRTVLLAIAQISLAASVHAQVPIPTDGRTCFCLEERGQDALTGCVGEKGPNDFFATATCWDEQRRMRTREVSVDENWTVVPDGQGFCRPCDPQRPTGPDGDRGGLQPLPGDSTTRLPGPLRPAPPLNQGR